MTEIYRRRPAPPDWPKPLSIVTREIDISSGLLQTPTARATSWRASSISPEPSRHAIAQASRVWDAGIRANRHVQHHPAIRRCATASQGDAAHDSAGLRAGAVAATNPDGIRHDHAAPSDGIRPIRFDAWTACDVPIVLAAIRPDGAPT